MPDEPPPPYTAYADQSIHLPSPNIQVYTTFVTPLTHNNSVSPNPISNVPSPQNLSSFASPLILTPPSTPSTTSPDLERCEFVSALPYFELQSPSRARPEDTIYHHLIIDSETSPVNLRFPEPSERWHAREVDAQDCTYNAHLFSNKTHYGS